MSNGESIIRSGCPNCGCRVKFPFRERAINFTCPHCNDELKWTGAELVITQVEHTPSPTKLPVVPPALPNSRPAAPVSELSIRTQPSIRNDKGSNFWFFFGPLGLGFLFALVVFFGMQFLPADDDASNGIDSTTDVPEATQKKVKPKPVSLEARILAHSKFGVEDPIRFTARFKVFTSNLSVQHVNKAVRRSFSFSDFKKEFGEPSKTESITIYESGKHGLPSSKYYQGHTYGRIVLLAQNDSVDLLRFGALSENTLEEIAYEINRRPVPKIGLPEVAPGKGVWSNKKVHVEVLGNYIRSHVTQKGSSQSFKNGKKAIVVDMKVTGETFLRKEYSNVFVDMATIECDDWKIVTSDKTEIDCSAFQIENSMLAGELLRRIRIFKDQPQVKLKALFLVDASFKMPDEIHLNIGGDSTLIRVK